MDEDEPGTEGVFNDELVYDLESKPPLWETLAVGFQHVLAMFAGIITPALIVSGKLPFEPEEKALFVSMALFASGAATLIQVKRIGPVGSGLLSVQGTSFTFVRLAENAAVAGGLPLVLGMSVLGAPAEILVSRVVGRVRRLFPPIVTGTAVMLIGLSLVKIGITDSAGGFAEMTKEAGSTFGDPAHLGLAGFVLVVILLLNRFASGMLKVGAVMIGIVCGYVVAALLGRVDFGPFWQAGWLNVPQPLRYGFTFDPRYFFAWFLAYVVTSIESIGDLTATSAVSNEPIAGPTYRSRIAGGTLADALGSILAAAFNSLPNTTFSQNNGVIQITGVASRRVGFAVAFILMALGLLPKLGMLVHLMPPPVLGGATVMLFGMVAAAGVRIVSMARIGGREMTILALSLSVGLGIEMVPKALDKLPDLVRITFGTGLVTGTLAALLLNLLLPVHGEDA